jgi:pteridine reductase
MSATHAGGRVALVTGGAVRLGRAIVEELAGAGWRVAFTFRTSRREAETLARALSDRGRAVSAIRADLDRASQRRSLVAAVVAEYGGIDALVNNAAIFPRTPIEEVDATALRAALRTNLESPLLLALACAPYLRAARGGIVNLADIHGLHPLRHHLPYSVSKAALIAATKALAVELAPEIRVNAIAPGIAAFPGHYDESTRRRLLGRTLLGREGGAAEIGRAVRYLLENNETMTGQLLVIDGGRTVAP